MSASTPTKPKPVTNPRGIPAAPFVESVTDYVSSRADVEPTLRSFDEMIAKYRFMELNTTRRRAGLDDKIPDIDKTLMTVRFLRRRREKAAEEGEELSDLKSTFELAPTLHAHASVTPADTDTVFLWLGANIMLAYPIAEADALLAEKLNGARASRTACDDDLDFLREQITTLEVATARVYNWDVVQRRKEEKEGKGEEKKEKE